MRTWLTSILAVIAGMLLFSACQQCMTCKIYDDKGNLANTEEKCGTSNELRAFEEDCQTTYQSVNYSCQCST